MLKNICFLSQIFPFLHFQLSQTSLFPDYSNYLTISPDSTFPKQSILSSWKLEFLWSISNNIFILKSKLKASKFYAVSLATTANYGLNISNQVNIWQGMDTNAQWNEGTAFKSSRKLCNLCLFYFKPGKICFALL